MFQHFLGRRSFYSRQPNRDSSSRSLANRDSSSRSLLRNVATVLGEVGRVEIFHHGFPRRLRSLLRNVSIFLGKCFSKNVETFRNRERSLRGNPWWRISIRTSPWWRNVASQKCRNISIAQKGCNILGHFAFQLPKKVATFWGVLGSLRQKAFPPLQRFGDVHYVGSRDLAAILRNLCMALRWVPPQSMSSIQCDSEHPWVLIHFGSQ